ncbi:glycerol-3-phosphate acyltransferase PlsY [Ruminococcus sp. YRD2003]|uniref:glycerol-3-phosphate 1-O-acyltransferase PlsY n=1 Tax=Ruminococcus sp. YRD2003 TaxID=1452313 RepID=UPI0008C2DA83|nr:glycerol-3-phosphate 1-O-acyltransferase PlsY [Ruminococcus sp.]SEK30819.1 glycerol-3-phosphate acyltransferase PlsY [Ruminococcus flavefaciens]
MKVLFALIIAAAIGYLLGSLNFSIIVVQLVRGKDIRTMGSRNAGLTNTYRCCGPACAGLTLLGDLLKGVVAVALARLVAGWLKVGFLPDNDVHYIGYIAAFFAIIGHVFPVYYGFKGGKGVLVGAASFIALDFRVFIALLAIFIVTLALCKFVSLSSIIATAYGPLAVFLMSWIVNGSGFGRSFLYLILSLPMAVMIIWMHRSNIERLMNNTETKFSFSSRIAD